jgi:hypothetical protein
MLFDMKRYFAAAYYSTGRLFFDVFSARQNENGLFSVKS